MLGMASATEKRAGFPEVEAPLRFAKMKVPELVLGEVVPEANRLMKLVPLITIEPLAAKES